MRSRARPWFLLLALPLVLGLAACGNDDGQTPDGGDTDAGSQLEGADHPGTCTDGSDNDLDGYFDCDDIDCKLTAECNPDTLSIYDLQDETSNLHPTPGTRSNPGPEVTVEGVIVTAVRPAGAQWHFYAQEADGGPYSGIYVFGSDTEVAVGDVVDVTGEFKEYYDLSEIDATVVTLTGETGTVAPEVVDPAVLATAEGGAEQWEGVLVEVQNVAVTAPKVNGTDGQWHGDWEVDSGLMIGNAFRYDYVPADGDAFQSIVGPLDFSYDRYKVQPRVDLDITFDDGSHPGEGPAVDVTIQAIQDVDAVDHPRESARVRVTGAVVTAVDVDAESVVEAFVMQQGTGEFSGIYVFVPTGVDASGLAQGDQVTVEGLYKEYFGMTQIEAEGVTITGAGELPAAELVSDAAVLAQDAATAEPWEGVLVTLDPADDMTVTQAPSQYGEWVLDDAVLADDDFFHYAATAGETIGSLTGVVTYSYSKYRLQPRSADDVVSTGATGPTTFTVKQLQDESDPAYPGQDTAVRVEGLVVTAAAYNATYDNTDAFVQDPAASTFGGLFLYRAPGELAVGDQVNVTGTYVEYFGLAQIKNATVEVTAQGVAAPAPLTLAAADVAGTNPAAEAYESMLVKVENVAVTEAQTASNTSGALLDWTVTDGVVVGHKFSDDYTPVLDDAFQSLVGVLNFSYDLYRLETRGNEDITFSDGTHPAPPASIEYTIQQVRAGDVAMGAQAQVVDAVVTALTGNGFWVQQGTQAHSGLFVYTGGAPTVAVGDQVTVEGTVGEYNSVLQLANPTVTANGTAAVTPAVITDLTLLDPAAPATEAYEGMLVTVQKSTGALVVDGAPDTYGQWTVESGAVKFDDILYAYGATAGEQLTSVTGVVQYDHSEYKVLPRDAADVVPAQ